MRPLQWSRGRAACALVPRAAYVRCCTDGVCDHTSLVLAPSFVPLRCLKLADTHNYRDPSLPSRSASSAPCCFNNNARPAMRRQRGIPRLPMGGAARSRGVAETAPTVFPMDLTSVKAILREYDRAAFGENFREPRLARIAQLGRGGSVCHRTSHCV